MNGVKVDIKSPKAKPMPPTNNPFEKNITYTKKRFSAKRRMYRRNLQLINRFELYRWVSKDCGKLVDMAFEGNLSAIKSNGWNCEIVRDNFFNGHIYLFSVLPAQISDKVDLLGVIRMHSKHIAASLIAFYDGENPIKRNLLWWAISNDTRIRANQYEVGDYFEPDEFGDVPF